MWKPFSHSLWRSCIPFCERKKKKDELKLNHREMYNVSNGRRPIPWSALCITSHRRTEKSRRLIHLHRGIQSCRDIFWCSGMGKKLRLVQCHEVQFKPESVCPHHHSVSWSTDRVLFRARNVLNPPTALKFLLYWTAYLGICSLRITVPEIVRHLPPNELGSNVHEIIALFFLLITEKKGAFYTQIACHILEKSDVSSPSVEKYQAYNVLSYFWLWKFPVFFRFLKAMVDLFIVRNCFFFFFLSLRYCIFLFPPQCQVAYVYLRKIIGLTWENEFMLAWPLLHCHIHFKWPRGIICINKNELLIGSFNCWGLIPLF